MSTRSYKRAWKPLLLAVVAVCALGALNAFGIFGGAMQPVVAQEGDAAAMMARTSRFLPNSNFSSGESFPTGWNPKTEDASVQLSRDTQVFRSSPSSLKLESTKNTLAKTGISFGSLPTKSFRISGYYKTQGDFSNIELWVQTLSKPNWWEIERNAVALAPSAAWKKWERIVKMAPDQSNMAGIYFALRFEGTGKVWLDDVVIDDSVAENATTSVAPPDLSALRLKTSTSTISARTSQKIGGWGGMALGRVYDWDKQNELLESPAVLKAYYQDLGLTFVRIALNWDIDWDAKGEPNQQLADTIRFLKVSQQYGIKPYIVSCWSPPSSMKTNNSSQCWDVNRNGVREPSEVSGRLRVEKEGEFVAWYVRSLASFKKAGLGLPRAIAIQNEPNEDVTYEGCLYTPEQWARVVKKMRAALDQSDMKSVQVFGPDSNYGGVTKLEMASGEGGYLEENFAHLARDPQLQKALGAYAFHSYNQFNLPGVARGVARFPKESWMTEHSDAGGENDHDWALYQVRHFISDMVDVPNSYWAHWVTAANKKAAPEKWALLTSGESAPILSKRFMVFAKLWKTVRPGWSVVKMTTNDSQLKASGAGQDGWVNVDMVTFQNPDATSQVVVLVNHAEARKMRVKGLKGQRAAVWSMATADKTLIKKPGVEVKLGAAQFTLPRASITLIETSP